ncbi:ATP-binding protein [Sphingobium sp. V4]|uniref:ATP-binding protein n=1 Tax=Sphingobium sp. V4 TaxID=3038927 RepID=UPI0025582B2A|nr:ATP-binding protein [Sphingobium sp. V4]WIW89618.1 ATP-binding protein [Sphingobium sp. V4]
MQEPLSALETAACLWEAVLSLRDRPVSHPDAIELALQIRSSFEAIGTSVLRMTVIGWAPAVEQAWGKVADDYALSFDWDFVPAWIDAHIDWSEPGNPVIRSKAVREPNDPGGHGVEEANGGGDDEVAIMPEAPMPFPTTIHTSVSPSLITRIGRFHNGGPLDVLGELLQNGRRAGATRIDIGLRETDRGPVLHVHDDGCGIADPAKFLALGDSGWDEHIARSEDPAGMGVFSLAGRHVTVRSYSAELDAAWQVTITPDAWETGKPLDVIPSTLEKGTDLEISLPENWANGIEQAVKDAARFLPVPVWFNEKRLPQESFLREASRIETWNGCRIGIFADTSHLPRALVRINFHGLTVPCQLPHIHDADGGRGWYAKVDIDDFPDLELVLPARKEVVLGTALDALREACEAAIFRTIAREGHHRLAYAHWLRANELGVYLPEAAPWLPAWTPRTAETGNVLTVDRIAGEPMILMPSDEAHIEQCVGRAISCNRLLGATPVDPVAEFAGYGWYDRLPRVLGWSFRIERGESDPIDYAAGSQLPPELVTGRVDAIIVELAIQTDHVCDDPPEILGVPADLLIVPADYSADLDEAVILLANDCTIEPGELASMLGAACFFASEDCEADSYHTQQATFDMNARFAANMLLLGEDTAIIERVREAVREHVSWLIPKNRAIAVRAIDYRVEAAFADDDEMSAPSAAE